MKNAPVVTKPTLAQKIAARFAVDPDKLMATLKSTAFRQAKGGEISDAQMMALMIVADQYGLNPFTKELYAYPDKQNGIVPVVSVDGWTRIINGNSLLDGIQFIYAEDSETPPHGKECPVYIDCLINRKDRSAPVVVREYLDECYRQPFKRDDGSVVNGPWQSHTKRMLRHKALIQCSRIAFGFAGIYDDDEAQRIAERDITPESIRIEGPRSKSAPVLPEPMPESESGASQTAAADSTQPPEEASPESERRPSAAALITPSPASNTVADQAIQLADLVKALHVNKTGFLNIYKAANFEELAANHYTAAKAWLDKKANETQSG